LQVRLEIVNFYLEIERQLGVLHLQFKIQIFVFLMHLNIMQKHFSFDNSLLYPSSQLDSCLLRRSLQLVDLSKEHKLVEEVLLQ
jgi:hypothetical protein